jgi:hypothetical protein
MSSKKKTNTSTTEQTHQTMTPTNPAWVDSGLQGLGGQISNLSNADPYSFVAGPDPLQTQAAQGAAGLTSSPSFQQASGIMNNVAGAGPNLSGGPASLLDNLQAYMSPYTKNVVDTSLADYDFGAGQTQAQNKLALAGDTTFGGSGGSIQTALSNDAITRGRGTLSAGLYDQAFQVGAGLSSQDAGRRQQSSQFDAQQRDAALQRQLAAGQGLGALGTAQGADQRANIGTQASLGDMLQQLAFQKAQAPLSLLGVQSGLMGQLPLGLLHGGETDGTGSTTGTSTSSVSGLGNALSGLGSLAMGAGTLGWKPFGK